MLDNHAANPSLLDSVQFLTLLSQMKELFFRCDDTRVHIRIRFFKPRTLTMVLCLIRNGAAKQRVINFCFLYIISSLTFLVSIQDIGEMVSCTGTMTSSNGALVNVNHPSDYLDNVECNITIRVPGAAMIEIIFDYFHTESESDFNFLNAMCTMDYLEISDNNESYRICGHWLGKEHLLYFRFYASELSLTFHSNEYNSRSGYKLHWYSTSGQTHGQTQGHLPIQCVSPLLETDTACFEVVSDPVVWEDGHDICRGRGAALAQIGDETIHSAIEQSLHDRNLSFTSFWIGAHDQLFEGDYMWTDRSTVGFTNWFPGWLHSSLNGTRRTSQPSDDGFSNEDCVEIRRHFSYPGKGTGLTKSFYWNDRDCSVKNPFICQHEKEIGKRLKRSAPFDCNGIFNLTTESPSVTFASPGFPEDYPKLLSCHVIIKAPPGFQIHLDFTHFHIEDALSRQSKSEDLPQTTGESCVFDNLTMSNFPATRPNNQVTFCGDWNARLKALRWTSDVSTAVVTLQTDNSKQFSGFRINASLVNKAELSCGYPDTEEDWVYGPGGCWQHHAEARNRSEARAVCQTAGGSINDARDNIQFAGDMIRLNATSSSCVELWTSDAVNSSTSTNESITGDVCSSVRVCGKNATGLLFSGYDVTTIQVPCSDQLAFICKRPKISTSYEKHVLNYTAASGSLTAFCNYSNNEDVTHAISALTGYRILLKITGVDIEYQKDCLYDFLEIYGSHEVRRLCGNSLTPLTLLSMNSSLVVRFKSDDDVTGCGFNMTWQWIRVNQTFSVENPVSDVGSISSLNFPEQFPDRLDGCFELTAPDDHRVTLELTFLNLPGNGCLDSFLKLRAADESIATFCGGSNRSDLNDFKSFFISTWNTITMCFKALSLERGDGFKAKFSYVPADTATLNRTIFVNPGDSVNVSSVMYPRGFPAQFYQDVEIRTALGHVLSFDSFEVVGDNKTSCVADSIRVVDLSLSLEPKTALFTSSCPFDDFTTSKIDMPSSFLNVVRITFQSGNHSNRIASMQFQGLISSVPDPGFLEKTVTTTGSFIGCEADTCMHAGQCTAPGNNRSTCACRPQYRGLFCQKSLCDLRPCRNGNCSLSSTGFTCKCRANYYGDRCDMDDVMCRWKMCSAHGRCVMINATQSACLCDAQWTGLRCADVIPVVPENLTIGQKLLKEPIWIGMIVILNLVLFFCISYIVRRKCGRKLAKWLPKRKKKVSAVKEDSRGETSVSSHYLEIPASQGTSGRLPRFHIPRGSQSEHSPVPSGPETPGVDDQNKEAAFKLFESYKSSISGLSPRLSALGLESKVLMKSHVTDFRTSGMPEGQISFSDDKYPDWDSPSGILRSYTINTGVQDSRSRVERRKRLNKGSTNSETKFKRSHSNIERGDRHTDTYEGHFDKPQAVHCFPEVRILNENNVEQDKCNDSDTSICVRTSKTSKLNYGPPIKTNSRELCQVSECIDSGYPSTTVSSSNTNPVIQMENSDRSGNAPLSAVQRRKMYSSKTTSSSFYNISASSQRKSNQNYFSLPEKRNTRDVSLGEDLIHAVDGKCRSCRKSRYSRGSHSCDSDIDSMSRRKEQTGILTYSRGTDRRKRHRNPTHCGHGCLRCNSNSSYIQSEPTRQSYYKHSFQLPSHSRHINVRDIHHPCTFSHSVDRVVSSSESEIYQRPRRHPKFKRKPSTSVARPQNESAELDQARRIERDFDEDEPFKATMLRSFLSDTYQTNITADVQKPDNGTMEAMTIGFPPHHNSCKEDMLPIRSDQIDSTASVVSYGNDFKSSEKNTDDMVITDIESANEDIQHTDETDYSVFGLDVTPTCNSNSQYSGSRVEKQVVSQKLSLKDSAYQTKQSSMDKHAPTLAKDLSPSRVGRKSSKRSDMNTRPDDKVKRHLHQAALKLAIIKRLQATEQFSKDSAIFTFSEDDMPSDEMDNRQRPLVKRSSGSLLSLQMKELNLSRVAEELSRETNTPTNEPQYERVDRSVSGSIKAIASDRPLSTCDHSFPGFDTIHGTGACEIDKSVTGIKSPSDMQMTELTNAKLTVSRLTELATEETIV